MLQSSANPLALLPMLSRFLALLIFFIPISCQFNFLCNLMNIFPQYIEFGLSLLDSSIDGALTGC